MVYYAPPKPGTVVKPKRKSPPPPKVRKAQYKTQQASIPIPPPRAPVSPPKSELPETPSTIDIPIPEDLPKQYVPIFVDYYKAIRRRIMRYVDYPLISRNARQEGTVYVRFQLDRDGQLRKLELDRSSGAMPLDQAALQSIRAAARFPHFPSNLPQERLTFHIQISFQLD